jgi:Holliday junction resolvase
MDKIKGLFRFKKRITTDRYDKLRKNWLLLKAQFEERLSRINKADSEYYVTASSLLELASRSYSKDRKYFPIF